MPKFKPKNPFRLHKGVDKPNKDSRFLSGTIREQIQFGGVNVYAWLLEGTFDQSDANGEPDDPLDVSMGELDDNGIFQGIQDVIFGENRDRKYADDAIQLVGVYTVSQNEIDFARFGIMLSNDIIQMEFHKEEMEMRLGRKLAIGDVIEMPHLKEVAADGRIKYRFYEVQSIVRSPSGFDAMYDHHVLAVTMRPIKDSQEFIDIMEREDGYGNTIGDQIGNGGDGSNGSNGGYLGLTAKIQEAAENQAKITWWDTTRLYLDPDTQRVCKWTDDGVPPNGLPYVEWRGSDFAPGVEGEYAILYGKIYRFTSDKWDLVAGVVSDEFPENPTTGYHVVRSDLDNEVFQYDGEKWNPVGVVQTPTEITAPTDHTEFPSDPRDGDFLIRLDLDPAKLYRFEGHEWSAVPFMGSGPNLPELADDNAKRWAEGKYFVVAAISLLVDQNMFAIVTDDGRFFADRVGELADRVYQYVNGEWVAIRRPAHPMEISKVSYFPPDPQEGDYVVRIDHVPSRLYRFQMGRWVLKEIDMKRDWVPYNWVEKLATFMTDRSPEQNARPWQYKSIHDLLSHREKKSNPSPKDDN